jgi:glycerol-3-phosphate dehydrogenase subunit B
MRELKSVSCDVLVIGHGAAGLFAAAALAAENKSVAVVGSGITATALSSGCVSIIRDDIIRRERGKIDLESLSRSVHPFNDIIERSSMTLEALLPEMSSFFVRSLSDQGLEMTDDVFNFFDLLTNAGTAYTCSIAPFYTVAGRMDQMEGSSLALLGIPGYRDLDPDLVIGMAGREVRGVKLRPYWAALPSLGQRNEITALEAAFAFKEAKLREELISSLKGLKEDHVAIPPIFRLTEYQRGMAKLCHATGKNVFELVTPLSLPGMRLQEAMSRSAVAEGARLMRGRTVRKLEWKGRRVTSAIVETRSRQQRISFNSLILASGDLVGGGLAVQGSEVRDPLGAFKVGKFEAEEQAYHANGYMARMHDVTETGFIVTNEMRLLGQDGKAVDNAFGAGAALASFSFPTGVGLGGCLLTSWVAAQHAKEVS